MFCNGLRLKTRQFIGIVVSGLTNFTTVIDIKKIIEVVIANQYLELYDKCTSKPKGLIYIKLATQNIKLEY